MSLIAASTLAMLIEYLVQLANSIIAGNVLGEAALSAVTLATPFFPSRCL